MEKKDIKHVFSNRFYKNGTQMTLIVMVKYDKKEEKRKLQK